ncbi:hypothetical protein V8Z80_05495 [Orrella sp. JC864]|uniref:hypothetical protein n=1 Tax=Orrella sp. JC864 TaxID=3120298 RepID=UPI0012BCDF4E
MSDPTRKPPGPAEPGHTARERRVQSLSPKDPWSGQAAEAAGRGKDAEPAKEPDRSLAGRPIDPNSIPGKVKFPPGVEPEDVKDPGRQTPGAPPVDNRSGFKK